MDAQFEHLCRICAANTKCRNNSVVESVFIFKTLGLKDKITRHLYLNVSNMIIKMYTYDVHIHICATETQ